jgi:hypothetical protein
LTTALIQKLNTQRSNGNASPNGRQTNGYSTGALAGLAVKILAQRCKTDEILGKAGEFEKKVVELYKVFNSAKQACLA